MAAFNSISKLKKQINQLIVAKLRLILTLDKLGQIPIFAVFG